MSSVTITSFEQLDGPDHQLWRTHRSLMANIRREDVGYRGCLGLGMRVEDPHGIEEYNESHIFVRDALILWYVMQDVPRGKWSSAMHREVHLASVRRTGFRYGMPFIGQLVKQFDFRRCPYDSIVRDGVEKASDDETLKPSVDEHAFKAFNAIEWAMTSTAFHFRGPWVARRKKFLEALGLPKTRQNQLLFGQEIFEECEPSRAFMPVPYIAFRTADADKIFSRATSESLLEGRRNYTLAFKQAFLDDLAQGMPVPSPISGRIVEIREKQRFDYIRGCKTIVIVDPETKKRAEQPVLPWFTAKVLKGTVVAKGETLGWDAPHQIPEKFDKLSIFRKWMFELPKLFLGVNCFESTLNMWFQRQHVRLVPGYIHLPATIAGQAALTLGVDEQLAWNIAPAMKYYNEPLDSFVFPTLRQGSWNEHRMAVTSEVELDVRLRDEHRFLDWPEDFVSSPTSRRPKTGKTEKRDRKVLATQAAPVTFVEEVVIEAAAPVVAPAPAPVTPEPHRVNKKEFRKSHKDATKGRPNAKKNRLHPETATRTVLDTNELNRVRAVLEMPLIDATLADNQPKADALAFENNPDARQYRRAYLPKTYEKVDIAKLTDDEWEAMVAARAAMKAQGVAT